MKTEGTKVDSNLGVLVHEYLKSLGIETPGVSPGFVVNESSLQALTESSLKELGLDLEDDSLAETPKRVAKMWKHELFWGLDYMNFPKATVVENKMRYDEMVLERNITVQSMCEHHLLPLLGGAHVAYIPKNKVLGLSKLNRIVDFFCRRPQIQERLTAQIFHTLQYLLETDDVAVCIAAEHLCVKIRGVEDACSDTVTSQLGGVFKSQGLPRQEFFSLINIGK